MNIVSLYFRAFNLYFMKKKRFVCVLFVLIAVFNIAYLFRFVSNIDETGLVDLNCYWNSGLYVRLRMNPYSAYLNKTPLPTEIPFIDGSLVDLDAVQDILMHPGLPGNTAPFVLFFTLFSFVPLRIAAVLWAIANFLISLMIPILILKIFETFGYTVEKHFYFFAVSVFLALNMTFRGIIGNGQTTTFILLFMLLSILFAREDRDVWAGISLGIALSKYNVAIPVVVYFLYKREWRILILSGVFQFAWLAALAAITQVSPFEILLNYLEIARFHATSGYVHGVNLGAYLPKNLYFAVGSFVFVSLLFVWIGRKNSQRITNPAEVSASGEITFLSLTFLWTLLGLYHLGYDTVLAIFPILWILYRMNRYGNSDWERPQAFVQIVLMGISFIGLIFPGTVFRVILPNRNLDSFAMTGGFILLTAVIANFGSFPTHARKTGESHRQTASQ